MFKNIQKYLLIHYPLLWNTKIIPLVFYAILIHIVFFIIGFANGAIDFTETETNYRYNSNDGTFGFLCVLVTLLSIIIWVVSYFKNNALKSFYPKNNFSIFKEWLLIFIGCLFLITFMTTYFFGKDVKMRSYYSEAETKKRCETLSLGSYFVDGSFEEYYDEATNTYEYENSYDKVDTVAAVEPNQKENFYYYKGVQYSYNSLLNKNLESYVFFSREQDSLTKLRIRNWLINNQKDSVKTVFKNYLALAKEHNLSASIDENKWLDLVYSYPKFEDYKIIGSEKKELYYPDNNPETTNYNIESQYIKKINGTDYIINKYYVPEKALQYAYSKIADSYVKPIIGWETYLLSLYVALGISLLLFSFRLTSGRSWLIAVVSLGVINIIIGILSAISSSEYVYLIAVLILFLVLFIYFFVIIYRNKGKKLSAITINAMLWMLPAFAPVVYFLVLSYAKYITNYNSYFNDRTTMFPKITFLQDNALLLMYLNLAFVFVVLFLMSKKFKQWRGITES